MDGRAKAARPIRPFYGHSGRLQDGSTGLVTVFLGFFLIFLATLFHDEMAMELAERGLIAEDRSERAELVIGLILFLCWTALTVVTVRKFDAIRGEAPIPEARRERDEP